MVPEGHTVTYWFIVIDYHPQKPEPHRTRLMANGDKLKYPWDVTTPSADLTMAKLLFNSIISTVGAKLFIADVKNFYYNIPLERFEYMQLPLNLTQEVIIQTHNLCCNAVKV